MQQDISTQGSPRYIILTFAALFSAVVLTGLCWHIYAQLNNNLLTNGRWSSSKLEVEKGIYGSAQYVMGLPTLSRGWANLGAWYGYQELILKQPVRADFLSFKYLLSTDSYVIVMLDRTHEPFPAIRLSNHPDYETAFITMDKNGKFLTIEPISHQLGHSSQWRHIEISIDHDASKVRVHEDDVELTTLDISVPNEQLIGFRGSYNPVYLDFIETRASGNEVTFFEDFSYRDANAIWKIVPVFALFFTISVGVMTLVMVLKKKEQLAMLTQLLFFANAVFALGMFIYYLHTYYISAYPNSASPLYPMTKYLELQRHKIEEYWKSQDTAPIVREYTKKGPIKVLFIGSSQTWGSGASTADKTFIQRAEQHANNSEDGEKYTFINTGKSGANSSELLELYKEVWVNFQPHVVVINLSNNDQSPEVFERNLRDFVRMNTEQGIETVFVLEANSPDFHPTELFLHRTMKKVAQEENIVVIDLHSFLLSKAQSGMLWWDNVHLTDYGHELAGLFLFEEMREVLSRVELKSTKD